MALPTLLAPLAPNRYFCTAPLHRKNRAAGSARGAVQRALVSSNATAKSNAGRMAPGISIDEEHCTTLLLSRGALCVQCRSLSVLGVRRTKHDFAIRCRGSVFSVRLEYGRENKGDSLHAHTDWYQTSSRGAIGNQLINHIKSRRFPARTRAVTEVMRYVIQGILRPLDVLYSVLIARCKKTVERDFLQKYCTLAGTTWQLARYSKKTTPRGLSYFVL